MGGGGSISFFTRKIVIHKYFNFALVGPQGKEQKASVHYTKSSELPFVSLSSDRPPNLLPPPKSAARGVEQAALICSLFLLPQVGRAGAN